MPTSRNLYGTRMRAYAIATVIVLTGAFALAAFYAPIEADQGFSQKIFYVHVPAATMALFVAVPATAVAGLLYLWLHDARLDRFAAASAEVSTVFCLIVLLTGPLWGKPIWGTWWNRFRPTSLSVSRGCRVERCCSSAPTTRTARRSCCERGKRSGAKRR